jgi:hypothetical protein
LTDKLYAHPLHKTPSQILRENVLQDDKFRNVKASIIILYLEKQEETLPVNNSFSICPSKREFYAKTGYCKTEQEAILQP